MKTFIMILVLISSVCVSFLNAQECIVVQLGEDITVYYESCLDEAFSDAPAGATIYLSGGNFSFCNEASVIDKKLTIIGAGVYPVATTATNRTKINGNIKLRPGAEGSFITGVRINDIHANIDDISISRCNFNVLIPGADIKNWLIEECILNGIYSTSSKSSNFIITKNFINAYQILLTYSLRYVYSSQINNNVFLANPYTRFDNLFDNLISNNVFSDHSSFYYSSCHDNFTFNNILKNYNQQGSSNNVDANSLLNQKASDHFVKYGSNNNSDFKFDDDYHLKESSAGKDYGTDGYDVGVYGTNDPFKENAVPFNPYIEEAVIANKSLNGGIKVKIKVEAQTK